MGGEGSGITPSAWVPSEIEILIRLQALGVSYRNMMPDLPGRSRNSIISKSKRLNLPARASGRLTDYERAQRPPNNPIKAERLRKRREADRNRAQGIVVKRHLRSKPLIDNLPPESVAPLQCKRVTLLELDNTACRWPLWGNKSSKHIYCGIPEANMLDGQPWCKYHAGVARGTRQTKPFFAFRNGKREQPTVPGG